MTEIDRIADELRRAWNGDPWHGSSLRGILHGITPRQAAARPLPSAHGIWEIVLHLGTWTREVARRLRDGIARNPVDPDWPPIPDVSDESWSDAISALEAGVLEVLTELRRIPESRLDEVMGDERNPELGSGVSYAVLLHGLSQHLAYHAGQIALLRKAFA
jgi:hypothetical protein